MVTSYYLLARVLHLSGFLAPAWFLLSRAGLRAEGGRMHAGFGFCRVVQHSPLFLRTL